MNEAATNSSASTGHRERLRARFLVDDASVMADVELLELLLTYAIPRRDVRPLAESLLAKFGSAAEVLAAASGDLEKISGIKESSVALLKLVHRLSMVGAACPVTPVSSPETSEEPSEIEPETQVHTPPIEKSSSLRPASKTPSAPNPSKKGDPPKLQVSNGYLLEPAQNAQVISFVAEQTSARKIGRSQIVEATGLSDRQIESLASVATALGLVVPRTQLLTPWGKLVHKNDLFLDSPVTLEFCHFLGAGRPRNLVWFKIFNELLASEKPTDQPGWSMWLRGKLAGQYSESSLIKHLSHEVRFVVDAYTIKNFKKLNLLIDTPDKTITLRRYTALLPLTLAAMIYWVGDEHEARLVSFSELQAEPGSPGRIFGLDASSFRQMVEVLHHKGWIRYEVRHGLDQIRLIDGFQPLEFLAAAYESREPEIKTNLDEPASEILLL
jgi:hypothetical protein